MVVNERKRSHESLGTQLSCKNQSVLSTLEFYSMLACLSGKPKVVDQPLYDRQPITRHMTTTSWRSFSASWCSVSLPVLTPLMQLWRA